MFKVAVCLAGMLAAPLAGEMQHWNARKLIEFGWDEPGTAFLRTNVSEMQRTPFDGCVFHADYRKPDGGKGSFTWQGWGQLTFSETDLQDAFADLRATRFGRFNFCFLRFNTTPARLDWFDDYSSVLANARLAARLARAGHCPGLLFDIEQYEGQLFDYQKQRDAMGKSWELYAAQTRRRGREVMDAFQEGYPGLTIFLTFGYSLPWAQTGNGKKSLANCSYGLLAPFLDGMLEGAGKGVRLVDGHELSYGYKTAEQFAVARKSVKNDLLPLVRDPSKYEQVMSLGFGLWLDDDWRKKGWDTEDLSKNYFPPQAFEASVREALRAADEFVWIYTETPRWWSDGGPVKLPEAYVQAVREAKAEGLKSETGMR
jgi:hypothetical protein